MPRRKSIRHHPKHAESFIDEEQEWLHLNPAQRLRETTKLWSIYLALGGSLDPGPNSQSPFHFPEKSSAVSANRRTGLHRLRRR